MRAAGLAALARGAGGERAIPVGEIDEVSISCAMDLLVVIVMARVVGRVAVPRPLERADIERPGDGRVFRRERMAERRLVQRATGYRATVKSGEIIFEDGEPTGALPGRLLRG